MRLAEGQEQEKTKGLGLSVGSRARFFSGVSPCSGPWGTAHLWCSSSCPSASRLSPLGERRSGERLPVGQEFEKPSGFEERSSSTEDAKCDRREFEKTEGLRVGLTGSAMLPKERSMRSRWASRGEHAPLPCLLTPDGSPQKSPTARASRSSVAPIGAQTPSPTGKSFRPLGAGSAWRYTLQSRA